MNLLKFYFNREKVAWKPGKTKNKIKMGYAVCEFAFIFVISLVKHFSEFILTRSNPIAIFHFIKHDEEQLKTLYSKPCKSVCAQTHTRRSCMLTNDGAHMNENTGIRLVSTHQCLLFHVLYMFPFSRYIMCHCYNAIVFIRTMFARLSPSSSAPLVKFSSPFFSLWIMKKQMRVCREHLSAFYATGVRCSHI